MYGFLVCSRGLLDGKICVVNSCASRGTDRKTATKQLKKLLRLEKEQSLDANNKSHIKQKIHVARVNLNYTTYYPLTEKYISLYPKSDENAPDSLSKESESRIGTKDSSKGSEDTKPPLWFVVEKCMEEGTLNLLREGKLNIGADGQQLSISSENRHVKPDLEKHKVQEKKPKKSQKNEDCGSRGSRSRARSEKQTREDYGKGRDRLQDIPVSFHATDSDGGFFEE